MKVKEIVDRERVLRLRATIEEHPIDLKQKYFKEWDEFLSGECELR